MSECVCIVYVRVYIVCVCVLYNEQVRQRVRVKTEHALHAIVHKISINVITPPENMCVPHV